MPSMNLACTTVGDGDDILFLHGWTMDRRDEMRAYEPVFAVKEGWRRHYIDLPGMGETSGYASIRNLDDILDCVISWLRSQFGNRSFAVAGTSAGAYLALGLAGKCHENMLGLALRAPVVEPDDARRDVDIARPIIREAAIEHLLDSGSSPILTASYLAARRARHADVVAPAMLRADAALLEPIRSDPSRFRLRGIPGLMPTFDKPALVIAGRLDDSVGYRDAWRLTAKLPRATYVALDRAEHGFPIDQQALFESLIADWLDRMRECGR